MLNTWPNVRNHTNRCPQKGHTHTHEDITSFWGSLLFTDTLWVSASPVAHPPIPYISPQPHYAPATPTPCLGLQSQWLSWLGAALLIVIPVCSIWPSTLSASANVLWQLLKPASIFHCEPKLCVCVGVGRSSKHIHVRVCEYVSVCVCFGMCVCEWTIIWGKACS